MYVHMDFLENDKWQWVLMRHRQQLYKERR